MTQITISEMSYEFNAYGGVDVLFSGEKIRVGTAAYGTSMSAMFSWKLYDSEGYVVSSGQAQTGSMAAGDRFKNKRISIITSLEEGEYTLKIEN